MGLFLKQMKIPFVLYLKENQFNKTPIMKKSLFLLVSIFLLGFTAHSQIYFRLGGGYALPMAKETIGYNEVMNFDGTTTTSTTEAVAGSYGAGVNINLGAGYMFSKFVGVDLGFNYLLGKSVTYNDTYNEPSGFFGREKKTETNSNTFFIAPSLVLSAGEGTKTPYARFGLIAGMPVVDGEDSDYDYYSNSTTVTKWETRKGASLGIQGAVGMNWMLSNNMKLTTEINFVSMKFSPDETVVTSHTYNGQDIMYQLSEYQKKTIYKDVIDNTGEPPFDQPRQENRINLPFSSVSFQVGIVYVLGGHSLE